MCWLAGHITVIILPKSSQFWKGACGYEKNTNITWLKTLENFSRAMDYTNNMSEFFKC